jgi:hypothetical protein
MRADDIDEAWVLAAARLVEIELSPVQLPGVIANLKRTALLAEPVMRLELDTVDELAPVWRP